MNAHQQTNARRFIEQQGNGEGLRAQRAAVAVAEAAAEGAQRPPALTGGESTPNQALSESWKAQNVIVDWCQGTFKRIRPGTNPIAMIHLWFCHFLMCDVHGEERGNGMWGYESLTHFYAHVDGTRILVGLAMTGGAKTNGTHLFQLNGHGCALVKDWNEVQRVLEEHDASLTRVDLAIDTLEGAFRVEEAADWYVDGGFTQGGRRPKYKQEGDWFLNQGSGKTFYVGLREHGKQARVYEKGKQLKDRWSMWNRFEVEIHNTNRDIPAEILTKRTEYFAGMYPICATLVDTEHAERIATLKKEGEISLAHLMHWNKVAYGRLIFQLTSAGHTPESIIQDTQREGVPRRLSKASLLKIRQGGSQRSIKDEQHDPNQPAHDRPGIL